MYLHIVSEENINDYQPVPGRGLLTRNSIKARIDHLTALGFKLEHITRSFIDHTSIQNNIESFVGSVEVPLGIVGPLLFNKDDKSEFVYTAAGTLEGALIASMNRGAKALSLSGGFTATVVHQKMIRAPLFMLTSVADAVVFEKWIKASFREIKTVAENFSNHAKLVQLSSHRINNNVHVRFVYTTGDASGQNMTTTCTWHAMQWMVENFFKHSGIEIPNYVIEGNGSSDKKASRFMIDHGRGVCVVAEGKLKEEVIKKTLRTSSEDLYRCFAPSVALANSDGMLGFNINVANAIAAIFVATGQDLASIHESSIGILELEKDVDGILFRLTLPSLVIGTIGGGTSVDKQQEALQLMNCAGNGKLERFAKLIAGFALSLEISTYSAIVSGEFAKAHEKLGRNKPNKWLVKQEVNEDFIRKCLGNLFQEQEIEHVETFGKMPVENGILTIITQRVNKKITGFLPITVGLKNGISKRVLIKSKALDLEVIKGLHMMAASIDPKLSDLLYTFREQLEYWNCHRKELFVLNQLSNAGFKTIPEIYGTYIDEDREIYFLFMEFINKEEMLLFDSENTPTAWTPEYTNAAIHAISRVHHHFLSYPLEEVRSFEPWNSIPLYKKMVSVIVQENENPDYNLLMGFVDELEKLNDQPLLPRTLIHNDFNPRNVCIRKNGQPCIYDWELAVLNFPHRDIVEFLCFALPENFDEQVFFDHLHYHHHLWSAQTITWKDWKNGYIYALKEFLTTRAAFYKVSEILMKLKFGDRIMRNGFRMIRLLERESESDQ